MAGTRARTTLGHISEAITSTSQPVFLVPTRSFSPLGNRWRGMPNARMRRDLFFGEPPGHVVGADRDMPVLSGTGELQRGYGLGCAPSSLPTYSNETDVTVQLRRGRCPGYQQCHYSRLRHRQRTSQFPATSSPPHPPPLANK